MKFLELIRGSSGSHHGANFHSQEAKLAAQKFDNDEVSFSVAVRVICEVFIAAPRWIVRIVVFYSV